MGCNTLHRNPAVMIKQIWGWLVGLTAAKYLGGLKVWLKFSMNLVFPSTINPKKIEPVSKWYTQLSMSYHFFLNNFFWVKLQCKFIFWYLKAVGKMIYRVVYEVFWKIWIWSCKMPSKLRQNFTLITVLSIDWYELCSKCSEMIHITDQNILRSEGNIFRLWLSHNWVQVDQKWTKMGQMVHTNNENCKMYKQKTLYLLDLAFAHFWT